MNRIWRRLVCMALGHRWSIFADGPEKFAVCSWCNKETTP